MRDEAWILKQLAEEKKTLAGLEEPHFFRGRKGGSGGRAAVRHYDECQAKREYVKELEEELALIRNPTAMFKRIEDLKDKIGELEYEITELKRKLSERGRALWGIQRAVDKLVDKVDEEEAKEE